MTAVDICPACGYPKFGPSICAYCLPVAAVDQVVDWPGQDDVPPAAAAG